MIVSPRGETFVHAIDSAGSINSWPYIVDVVSSMIGGVGAKSVVQVVMDNAKNCKHVGKILKQQYPHVYPCSYNTHSLNIILKD